MSAEQILAPYISRAETMGLSVVRSNNRIDIHFEGDHLTYVALSDDGTKLTMDGNGWWDLDDLECQKVALIFIKELYLEEVCG